MVKTYILDFDGTMGDTRSLIVKTMQQTIAELGLPKRTDNQCASMIGLPLKQTFTDLIPMDDDMGNLCAETYTRIFAKNNVPGAVPVFPNVQDTIKKLYESGCIITIASSRRRQSLLNFIDEMKLNKYISFVVSASDVDRAKPFPDMVYNILEETKCKPDESIVVGDTTFDIEMGKSAGSLTCGVTYGNGTRVQLVQSHADYIINDFSELLNI